MLTLVRLGSAVKLFVAALALTVALLVSPRVAQAQFTASHSFGFSLTGTSTHTVSYSDQVTYFVSPSPAFARLDVYLIAQVYTLTGTYKGSAILHQASDLAPSVFTAINNGAFRSAGATVTNTAANVRTKYNQQNPSTPLTFGQYYFKYAVQGEPTVTWNFSTYDHWGGTYNDSRQFPFTVLN